MKSTWTETFPDVFNADSHFFFLQCTHIYNYKWYIIDNNGVSEKCTLLPGNISWNSVKERTNAYTGCDQIAPREWEAVGRIWVKRILGPQQNTHKTITRIYSCTLSSVRHLLKEHYWATQGKITTSFQEWSQIVCFLNKTCKLQF